MIPRETQNCIASWREMAARWLAISPNDPLGSALSYCAQELEDAIALDEAASHETAEIEERPAKQCNVYIIRRPGASEVKIGISIDPVRRLRQLQSTHTEQLELVAYFLGTAADEADLHQRFKEFRKRGEWFHEAPEISAWIEGIRS